MIRERGLSHEISSAPGTAWPSERTRASNESVYGFACATSGRAPAATRRPVNGYGFKA
jgi:hypothetical protein